MSIQITGATLNGTFITGATSTPIINTGLQLYLDALNITSYPGTGPTWYDLSGNGNDVTMQNSGSITWNPAGYFATGSTGWFNRASSTNIPIGNSNYTLSVWVQLGSSWGSNGFISVGPFGATNQANAFRTSGTNAYYNYWWGNDLYATSTLLPATQWFNAVAKFNGTTRSIWINAVQKASDTPSGHNVTSSTIQIAKTVNTEYLQGNIGQALIYNRALSDSEILDNFNATKTRFGL
jgi:hypothetical protein